MAIVCIALCSRNGGGNIIACRSPVPINKAHINSLIANNIFGRGNSGSSGNIGSNGSGSGIGIGSGLSGSLMLLNNIGSGSGSGSSSSAQHTFIDTEHNRIIYKPLEEHLILVLITTKNSNIIQDMETMGLLSRLVAETVSPLSVEEAEDKKFELIFGFDEVMIVGSGYFGSNNVGINDSTGTSSSSPFSHNIADREMLEWGQLKTILNMESHEEIIQEMIAKNKEREAKETAKLKMKQLEMQRREQAAAAAMAGIGGGVQKKSSFGNLSSLVSGFSSSPSSSSFSSGGNTGSNYLTTSPSTSSAMPMSSGPKSPTGSGPQPLRGKGMQLKKSSAQSLPSASFAPAVNNFAGNVNVPVMNNNNNEDDHYNHQPASSHNRHMSSTSAPDQSSQQPQSQSTSEGIFVKVEERITLHANRDGGVQQMEVKGDLFMKTSSPNHTHLSLSLSSLDHSKFQFKTHPNIDKKLFQESSILALKDSSKPFPLNQNLGILKWRFVTDDERFVPLSINCWPSGNNVKRTVDVNIEYSLENTAMILTNVTISIPLPNNNNPIINSIDGEYEVNRQHKCLEWHIPFIDSSSPSGTLEFSLPSGSPDSDVNLFFPVQVFFTSATSYGGVAVSSVVDVGIDGGSRNEVPFVQEISVVPEEYAVL